MQSLSQMTPVICGEGLFLGFCWRTPKSISIFRDQISFVSKKEMSFLLIYFQISFFFFFKLLLLLECVCEVSRPQHKVIKFKGEQIKI